MSILKQWERFSRYPGGKALFSCLVGRFAPYSGSIGAHVEVLRPGYAEIRLRERKKISNHLGSIHAVALMNLCELTSGLSMLCGLPENIRGIVTGFSIEYKKKSRGLITAIAEGPIPNVAGKTDWKVHVKARNEAGEVVCEATATWLLDLKKA